MEVADSPFVSAGFLEFIFQPLKLWWIHVIAVEDEKTDVAFFVCIILCAIHIERLVKALAGVVMIAQRRVELYSCVKQRFIGCGKFLFEIAGIVASVNVVTQHNDEAEREFLM